MKNYYRLILILLIFFSQHVWAQEKSEKQINTTWQKSVNHIFQRLNKDKIPQNVLLDYAMEFTDVIAYNGKLTDTTQIDINVLGNIYKTLLMGQLEIDTLTYPKFATLAKRWARQRKANNNLEKRTMVMGGLFYNYAKIDSNAVRDGKIVIENDQFYDTYVNGVWQDPYKVKQTFAVSPPINHLKAKNFQVLFPEELFLSNNQYKVGF